MKESLIMVARRMMLSDHNQGFFHTRDRLRCVAWTKILTQRLWKMCDPAFGKFVSKSALWEPKVAGFLYENWTHERNVTIVVTGGVCRHQTTSHAWKGHYAFPLASGSRVEGQRSPIPRFLTKSGVGVSTLTLIS